MSPVLLFVVGIAAVSAQSAWQGYVDDQLVGSGMTAAAIFGHDGSVWAKNNIEPTTEETKKILEQFLAPGSAYANGIILGGVKYFAIKADTNSLYGKKGAGGIVLVKSDQTVIAGVYDEHLQPGQAATTAEKLGDYLRGSGY